MKHERELTATAPKDETAARELAACYARVFLSDEDGKRVLADLRRKFGLQRLVFNRAENGRYDAIGAALIDGERRVISEIEEALRASAPNQNPLLP